MTREEKLEKIASITEEETNFDVIKEMKIILNKVFGEEYNQIIKPTAKSIRESFIGRSGQNGLNGILDNVEKVEDIISWFKNNRPRSLEYQIIIYFPKLEITNGRQKHEIKELYVRAFIKPSGQMQCGISGVRAHLTEEEALSNYVHSHLNAQCPESAGFSDFCTGEGPINQVMLLLKNKFTIPNFMLFCLHLKNFVVWESKEGRPYMYIENIGKITSSETSPPPLTYSTIETAGLTLIRRLKLGINDHEKIYDMLDFKVSATEIVVKATRKFELWAGEAIRTWDPVRNYSSRYPTESYLAHVDNSGLYHPILLNSTRRVIYDPNKVILQFKEQDVKLKIESSNKQTNTLYETVPQKRITEYFCEKLSHLLTNAAFDNALVKTCSAGTDNTETPESDPIHVQGSVDQRVVGNAVL